MQQVFITAERLKSLKKGKANIELLERICKCKIKLDPEGGISIEADNGYSEFVAKTILQAYGRGFEMKTAELLDHDDYYFSTIDIGNMYNENRTKQIKARIIGEKGKTKTYIERVSGAHLSIYGDTISFIGTASQIEEAKTAIIVLLEGGTHKLAYARMEAAHRKNKTSRHNATF